MAGIFDLLAPIYDKMFPPKKPTKLLQLLNFERNNRMVELGGGTGRITQFFIPYYEEVWLLEPSASMIKQAKKNYPSIRISHSYSHETQFPSNYFDLILIYDSFHHWDEQRKAINEIARIIKVGGTLVIGEIHPTHRMGYWIILMERLIGMNSSFYSPQELKGLVKQHGFSLLFQDWLNQPTYFQMYEKTD